MLDLIDELGGANAVAGVRRFDQMLGRFERGLPTGTLIVNVLGSFLMGFLWIAMAERVDANSALRAGLTVGLLGAFTTFSTFSLEALAVMQNGELAKAGLTIALSNIPCIAGCALGMMLARLTIAQSGTVG